MSSFIKILRSHKIGKLPNLFYFPARNEKIVKTCIIMTLPIAVITFGVPYGPNFHSSLQMFASYQTKNSNK